jgi:hypothetical protein
MFQFLLGVAFGAAGYWAWESFGRDLLGMGADQDTTYGGFSSPSSNASYSSIPSSTSSTSSSDGGSSSSSVGSSTSSGSGSSASSST